MLTAEQLKKGKIPCPETGIEIRHTVCAICSPSYNCGINAYVKDGKVIKVEGTDENPRNKGLLCPKGLSNRQFIYRPDRILTPLRRTGERGEGKFEPITWDEAYDEIVSRLNAVKAQYGPDAVAFFGGYNKWYRPWLQRLAHSFGTLNYGTESSTCMTAGWMAWKVAAGTGAGPDMARSDLFLGWAYNSWHSGYLKARSVEKQRQRGMKVLIVDPNLTVSTETQCDLHLRPYPGTDSALALCMGNILIERGWIDRAYIEKYVHGFQAYAGYAKQFNESNVERLTGVPYGQVVKACEMIHAAGSMCVNENSAPIPHSVNGLQNYRAIMALLALTGNFDRPGGQLPSGHTFAHQKSGFETREDDFALGLEPKNAKSAIGAQRFPLWFHLQREMQAVDLARQILDGTPYPVKAVLGFGMNYRMLPEDQKVRRALQSLDFFMDTDLFLTDTAKLADIVLPVCSSFERGEFMTYPGCYAWMTKPAVDRVGESKSDVEVIRDLSVRLGLGDELMAAGYEANIDFMLRGLDISVSQLKEQDLPVKVPHVRKAAAGELLEKGLNTPTGKFELYSELIAAHPEWGLDPLPTYADPLDGADAAEYPFILATGGRLPNAIHSRLHQVEWPRSLRPEPTAEMFEGDGRRLGLESGDTIEIYTALGSVCVKVHLSHRIKEGMVNLYHGYSEADVNTLISETHVDPYSGFPGYNGVRCGVRKKVEA